MPGTPSFALFGTLALLSALTTAAPASPDGDSVRVKTECTRLVMFEEASELTGTSSHVPATCSQSRYGLGTVAGWKHHMIEDGTVVYHYTSVESVNSIIDEGIRPVENRWGGGVLGQGFYSHRRQEGAQNYGQVGLQLRVIGPVFGQVVPRTEHLGDQQAIDYLTNNDYLTNEDDLDEIKFHDGEHLILERIHMGGDSFTLEEWESFR